MQILRVFPVCKVAKVHSTKFENKDLKDLMRPQFFFCKLDTGQKRSIAYKIVIYHKQANVYQIYLNNTDLHLVC